jgi:hypothetical protein
MKNIISFFAAFLFTANVFAQAPEKMSYQAVVRDANGVLISNSLIGVQVSITKSAFFPIIVYSETHSATTNVNGLLTLAIGTGTPTYGSFSTINWGEGTYNISTTIDLTGGTNFNGGLLSTTQLLSVPYAMYAKASGTSAQTSTGCPDGTTIGEIKYWDGTEWITIAPALNGNFLQLVNGVPTWSNISSTVELPTLSTNTVSNITPFQAYLSGYVVADGGGPVAERGFCYGTSQNPTIQDNIVACGNGLGSFNAIVPGLISNTNYNARTYATNSAGTVYGNQQSFTTLVFEIGISYLGGILAYILQPGDPGYNANVLHGIIAAPSDQSTGAEWGCNGTAIPGASGIAIGTGAQNTIDIENGCATAGTAADICANLVLGGYSDWYLPSREELHKLYLNKVAIGGFASDIYCSSSQINATTAWGIDFFENTVGAGYLKGPKYVRAVRAF